MDFREGEGEKKKAILCLWRSIITLLPSPLSAPHPGWFVLLHFVCTCHDVCPWGHVHLVSLCTHAGVCMPVCVCMHMCAESEVSIKREWVRADRRAHCGLIKHFRFNTPSLSLTQTLPHHSSPPHFSWRIERREGREGTGLGEVCGGVTVGGDLVVVARCEGTRDEVVKVYLFSSV